MDYMKKESYNLIMGMLILCLIILVVSLMILDQQDAIPQLSPKEKETQKFIECVNKTGLQLYGKLNSQVFLTQKEELGDLFDKIPFVDCLEDKEDCMGILLVPAWKLNGQIYYGSFSKEILIKLMECE